MDLSFQNSRPELAREFRIIMNLRLFFGFYYVASRSKLITSVLRAYSLICIILVLLYVIYYDPIELTASQSYASVQAIISLAQAVVMKGQYFMKFFTNILVIDKDIRFRISLVSKWFLVYIVVSIIINTLLFEIERKRDIYYALALTIIAMACTVYQIPKLLVFELTYRRICWLRKIFEKRFFIVGLNSNENAVIYIVHMRKCLRIYYQFLDNLHEGDLELQIMLFLEVMFNFPILLILVSNTCMNMKHIHVYEIISASAFSLSGAIRVLMPGLLAQMTSSEVQKIKKHLLHEIAQCEGVEVHDELQHTLQCITLRPFRYSIFRAIPVDGTLPFKYISLCFTYVIVILQLNILE